MITVQHATEMVEVSDNDTTVVLPSKTLGSHIERLYHPHWTTRPQYRCPRDIPIHHGDPTRCGRACKKAGADGKSLYKGMEVLHLFIVDMKTEINYDACVVSRETLPVSRNRYSLRKGNLKL